jgi:iron complex transport system substrate-binding protein
VTRTLAITLAALVVLVGVVAPAAATPAPTEIEASANPTDCTYPFERTDATGATVTVEEPPESVVVVGASGAQTMWEIGAQDTVVGMTVASYTTYLDGAEDRPDVTDDQGFANVEKVLEQEPDMVLLANIQRNETAQQLRDAGVTVYKFRPAATINDIYNKTHLTGKLVGACEGADGTVSWMRDRVETVRETVDIADRPSILYPQGFGYAPGPGSFIDHILTTAGGDNVVASENFSTSYPQLSSEFIVEQDPTWLVATYNPGVGTNASTPPKQLLPDTAGLNQTTAWEEDNLAAVNQNYLNQPAPRVVYPLQKIASELHPVAYARANQTTTTASTTTPSTTATEATTATATTTTATTTATSTRTTTATTATTTESGGQPGVGVVGALLALLAALVVRRR